MEGSLTAVVRRIDGFCDEVPRQWATAEDDGPLRLFVRDGRGWPFYARPVPGGRTVTGPDVTRVRARQRALRLPEAFEWVPAAAPSMLDAVRDAGLTPRLCPLLVLDGEPPPAPFPPGYEGRLLGPADGDLATAIGVLNWVAAEAFGLASQRGLSTAELAVLRDDLAEGRAARLLVTGPDGPVAAGSAQRSGDVVEIVGVGTLPAARRQGLAGAVTAALAEAARAAGADVVFLAAADEDAARVYQRVGFRVVGHTGIAEAS
ncbi:GNAT family N-acetyltransferase [Pseudonocardia lacus]|uniref:GNAT family N-acetyltransferase n=1 Tax=Pseudonocardia lacus TaxID=2835865 RepID=UPI001BDC4442|nr:GNAT family N-acetyltransferase [Pseudonocardia lacus]